MSTRLLLNVNVAWFFLSHRLAIARAARAAGFDVHVAGDILSDEEIAAVRQEGLTFHRLRLSRGGLLPGRDLAYLAQLMRLMRRLRPDLVHNITAKPIVYGTLAARALGVRAILNAVSGLGYSFSGASDRWLLSRVVAAAYRVALRRPGILVIFQNDDDVEAFVGARIIDRAQAILIRGSGVDLAQFAPSAEPAGPPRVLLPARMLRDKGILEFARAAQLLRSQGAGASFLLAGMLDEANPAALSRDALTRLQQESGLQWLGQVADMPALLRSIHVVCLPSYREGFPKALIEACAAGRPIVATDVPGCREVVEHGVNGLLVRVRDVPALADALQRLLSDAEMRVRMGAAGRRKAEAEFGVGAVVRATLEVYRKLLD